MTVTGPPPGLGPKGLGFGLGGPGRAAGTGVQICKEMKNITKIDMVLLNGL